MSGACTATPAVDASGLVKVFGGVRAVDGLDLLVPRGGVYALLGPNGAGKTTTIRLLTTLLSPDAGQVRVFGHDVLTNPDEVRSRISLTGQYASLDEDLTGHENLTLLGRLLGYSRAEAARRADELLQAFDLTEAAGRQVKRYSGGMRRRLDIAASVVVRPELLVLDEPTTGLDPHSRNQVWDMVRALVADGTSVLLSTQYLDEADKLADRVAVMNAGRVIAEGTPAELKALVGADTLSVRVDDAAQRTQARQILEAALERPVTLDRDPLTLSARVSDPERVARALLELTTAGITTRELSLAQASLDEVFLALTGRPTDGDAGMDAKEVAA